MGLIDYLCGPTHRVLQVKMELVDQDTGAIISRKIASIHETDVTAGEWHLFQKSREVMADAAHELKQAWRPTIGPVKS